jgi:hypothetical protein
MIQGSEGPSSFRCCIVRIACFVCEKRFGWLLSHVSKSRHGHPRLVQQTVKDQAELTIRTAANLIPAFSYLGRAEGS